MSQIRKSSLRRKLFFILILMLCTLLQAARCDGTQEENPTEMELRQLELSASQFIEALFTKRLDGVMDHSGFPFYLNHQAILGYPDEWQQVLLGLFAKSTPTPVQILDMQPLTSKDMEDQHPRDLALLMEHGFYDQQLLLVTLQTQPPGGQPSQEKVLLLVNRMTGKVVGFIR